ncbi:MAG: ECF transporter S component [Lachnospiraceae bacterium]|nr:ECF transporter S component [Lachnospiraceae bacterium]
MQGNSLFETIREWFTKRGDTVSSLGKSASSSLGTVFIFIAVIAGVVFIAIAAQRLIDKKNGTSAGSEKFRVNRIAIMAMLSAVAIILNLFSFPLWFVPGFYKIDLSELPVVIGAFALGPVAGVTIEAVKIILNLLFNGTSTAFVGEIANFIMGCAYVVPAGIIYYNKKSRKNAFIGLGIGTLISITAGSLLNAFLLLPVYAKIYGMPLEALIAMGTAKNASINGMTTFILLAVAPFNLIKYGLVSIITMLIYKPVSRLLKGH